MWLVWVQFINQKKEGTNWNLGLLYSQPLKACPILIAWRWVYFKKSFSLITKPLTLSFHLIYFLPMLPIPIVNGSSIVKPKPMVPSSAYSQVPLSLVYQGHLLYPFYFFLQTKLNPLYHHHYNHYLLLLLLLNNGRISKWVLDKWHHKLRQFRWYLVLHLHRLQWTS